jgi:hypothetical protein
MDGRRPFLIYDLRLRFVPVRRHLKFVIRNLKSAAALFLQPISPPNDEVRAIHFRAARISRISRGRSFPENCRAFFLFRPRANPFRQFAQKFFRRPLRRAEIKSFFEIKPDRVGNQNAKFLRLRNECERFFQFLFRANVRGNRRRDGNVCVIPCPMCRQTSVTIANNASAPSVHHSHSQPLGISIGGLMSRMSLCNGVCHPRNLRFSRVSKNRPSVAP